MKKMTNYPSIDKLHEKGYKFSEKKPIIPNMSIYNTICHLMCKAIAIFVCN